jgi:hypothetical protein
VGENETKKLEVNLWDQIAVSEVMIGTGEGPSGEGVRRVDDKGHSTAIDRKGENVSERISGPTIQNEEGTRETCQILMEKLNELGADWCRMALSSKGDPIDGRLFSACEETRLLEIQVSKADQPVWAILAKSPDGISRTRNTDKVCESILVSIEKKKHISKGSYLVLALEAVHFPVVQAVADEFQKNYQSTARSFGFHQIWLVGPIPRLTFQLA